MIQTIIALKATPEEVLKFSKLKKYYGRKTGSDTMRFLIQNEYDKIFCKK